MTIQIVYGPSACGKTRNKSKLAKHYAAAICIDGFWAASKRLIELRDDSNRKLDLSEISEDRDAGILILTNMPEPIAQKVASKLDAGCTSFAEAMAAIEAQPETEPRT